MRIKNNFFKWAPDLGYFQNYLCLFYSNFENPKYVWFTFVWLYKMTAFSITWHSLILIWQSGLFLDIFSPKCSFILLYSFVTWLKRNVTIIGCGFLSSVLKATGVLTMFPLSYWHLCLPCHLLVFRCSSVHVFYSWPQIPARFLTLWITLNFWGNLKWSQQWQNTKSTRRLQLLLFRAQLASF